MTRMEPAHLLVLAEWPHIAGVPAYDFQIATAEVHLGVYVRRVSGANWHTLAGLVNHVVVAPAVRGKGLGGGVVIDALAWLRACGIPFAHVHCDPEGAGFYERYGFFLAPNFPAPSHRGSRVSMVATVGDAPWPSGPVEYVEPW